MKRIGNIYDKISSLENLEVADSKARKGKLKSYGVQKHTKIQSENLNRYLLDNTLSKYHDEYYQYLAYVANVKQFVKQDCADNAILIDD